MIRPLYLIVGKSGSGKTTIADFLTKYYGYKQLYSYTTRKPRFEGETGHTFVDSAPDNLTDMPAYTHYNGAYYWVTWEQLREADIYIIDPKGANVLLKKWKNNRELKLIYVDSSDNDRLWRMKKDRGEEAAKERIEWDRNNFGEFNLEWSGRVDMFFNNGNAQNKDGSFKKEWVGKVRLLFDTIGH